MAKFYQRYLPPPTEKTIQYGYRGTNYTINGAFYTVSNSLEQVGNYQYNPACIDLGCTVAPLAVDSLFEPTYQGSTFDLLGSRFSGEYAAGCFLYYGTNQSVNNITTFKNQTCQGPACYQINTSTSTACLTGCVLPGSCQTCAAWNGIITLVCPTPSNTNTQALPYGSISCYSISGCNNATNCCAMYNYLIVQDTGGNFSCFVPQSNMYQLAFVQGCCANCYANCFPMPEYTYGDTPTNYTVPNAVCPCNQGGGGSCNYALVNFPAQCTIAGLQSNSIADQLYYGTTCRVNLCVASTCSFSGVCSNNVYGNYVNYGVASGTAEYGVRTLIQNAPPFKWYFHYNALNGGVQGVDTTTSGNVRLTLRQYNANTTVTTVVYNIKKGISGLIIPSQPDQDDTVAYRFYHIAFGGADTANTMTISRYTLTSSTGAAAAQAYTLQSMTAAQITSIYTALGHNGTANSQLNNASFRRQTVNRVWYSVDTNSVKRLHMGVYNTNGTGLVSIANTFNLDSGAGAMFRVWSWSLDDVGFNAYYLGYVSLATYAPRYFCPLDTYWNTVYAGATFGNDIVLTLNATTGLYQYQSTMPYIASRLFKDHNGRWATQVVDTTTINNNGGWTANTVYTTANLTSNVTSNYIDVISASVGETLIITAPTTSFVYTGSNINGNITVNVYNYAGQRIATTVTLSIVGQTATPGITFNNGTYAATVTTSTSADTIVGIVVISSANAKIVGTVAAA